MAKFAEKVDRAIALVKERKTISIDLLAHELRISPDYARKAANVAVSGCTDPPLVLERLYNRKEGIWERPALWVKSYYEERRLNGIESRTE
jgi:hypothetical protein